MQTSVLYRNDRGDVFLPELWAVRNVPSPLGSLLVSHGEAPLPSEI